MTEEEGASVAGDRRAPDDGPGDRAAAFAQHAHFGEAEAGAVPDIVLADAAVADAAALGVGAEQPGLRVVARVDEGGFRAGFAELRGQVERRFAGLASRTISARVMTLYAPDPQDSRTRSVVASSAWVSLVTGPNWSAAQPVRWRICATSR
ncbi:hypothetical protein NI18_19990, partial [Sphingomonas sp. Ant20]